MAEGGQSLNLSCSICFEEFKIPKMLPCGHTFCCQCLSKMLDSFLSLQCPTCRKDVSLPESGNVDDFPTNFALMNFIPDHEAMGEVDNEFKCPHHEAPMEFYCTSCEKQVCAKCLLKNHKPDKHNIVTASDIASNLSCELQKLEKELQECKAEVTFLGGRIFRGHDCQQQDKERLEQAIQVTLEIEQEKLKKAGENLLNKLKKTVEDQTSTYANLKKRHETLHTLSNRIEKSCKDLNQRFEQLCLSESTCEIQKVLKSIATLKDAIKSVKISCQSTPTSVGLDFARTKDNLHRPLGRLTTVPSKPIFLESTDSTKDDSSQTTGKVSTQVCYRRPMPPSVFLGHPAITTPISATLTSGITAKHPVYDAGHGPLTAQVLSQVGPYEQKQMIGERLFSIIKQSHPKLAGTITGMMLKTDNAELLHVLETPQALNAKVSEAVAVLEAHDPMYTKK